MNNIGLIKNPFLQPSKRPEVYVAAGAGPYENTCRALAQIDLSAVRGRRVLLKPNAGRMGIAGEGITTDPQVVAAAIDVFNKAGAAVVALGESPITGVKALDAFESTGMAQVARERHCDLIDLDIRPSIDVDIPDGQVINNIKVCADLFDFDLIVSIPVMKVHMHTGVTLAVKNMKGCLWKRSKVDLHMLPPIPGSAVKPLDVAIADMSAVLRPHLSIIDGTVGMEGMGPSAGEAKALGLIVVGPEAFAADAVACSLMGIAPASIPHLHLGAKRGYGLIDLGGIDVRPHNWPVFAQAFAPAPDNLSIEFPNTNILDENSCSACQSTLLLFLKRHGGEFLKHFPKDKPVNIAIGKGHTQVPKGTLCLGNCTAHHKKQGIFVAGCPPVGSAIMLAVSDKRNKDDQ